MLSTYYWRHCKQLQTSCRKCYTGLVHQILSSMLCIAELDMVDWVDPSDIYTLLANAKWAIQSNYHILLKASPGEAIFDHGICSAYPSSLAGTKFENKGNTELTSTWIMKLTLVLIGTTKLVAKYLFVQSVSSTNQRVGMNMIPGLSHHFNWMGLSWFNTRTNQKALTYQKSCTLIQKSTLISY
jgi:hypothetical protein